MPDLQEIHHLSQSSLLGSHTAFTLFCIIQCQFRGVPIIALKAFRWNLAQLLLFLTLSRASPAVTSS